ncbi:alkaline phosphatase D family protein [Porphyrobacter sp. LM 6]|uniref:alkaline phosphatase D family protein n=1 Tax=Porphyrobacter sp. LM 6 TaxID=1896196 RepID=UPI00084641E5|nr:alkaline phosphatase D family protein [Porphyrobacter sp. LM 6]AOL94311.1 alkaline phosphatase D [Porphyrobacter sp. LM 6]
MRLSLLAATALAAAGFAAAPLLADNHAARSDVPDSVSLSPDQLLAPYYAELRKKVAMPEAGPNPALSPSTTLTRIAFGSCNHQSAPQHMWAQIASANPQLFLMIGDNVYGDNGWDGDAGLESLRASYALQASHPEFAGFRAKHPMMATWDDHDFGLNDAGGSFPMRRWAEELFESFWGSSDAVRARPGIYDSTITGPEGKRVQVILLDTRFFRSDLKRMAWTKDRPPLGGYLPDDSAGKTVLGADQWAWLAAELAKPADVRIVVSSTQVITQAHQFEGWTNFPAERTRLLDMLAGREASGLVILSGDRHAAGIYKTEHKGETMWELTSSSLNLTFGSDTERSTAREPDPTRISPFFPIENYGLIDIDWKGKGLTMTLKGNTSATLAEQRFSW